MTTPLDRIRGQVGVSSGPVSQPVRRQTEPSRHQRPHPRQDPASPSAGAATRTTSRRSQLGALLAASRSAPADLSSLRTVGIVVGVAAGLTVLLHPLLTTWVGGQVAVRAGSDGMFDFSWMFDWLFAVLTVWQAHQWVPFVAVLTTATLIGVAVSTEGFRHGRSPQAIALVAACGSGAVACLPVLITLMLGLAFLVIYVGAYVVVVVAVIAMGVLVLQAIFDS